jgi:hypothetical protein
LKPAEKRYSAFGRELLGAYLAVKHFRYFIDGRTFRIYTDHMALTKAITSGSDSYSPRETRHLDYIAQFTTDLQHVSGPPTQSPTLSPESPSTLHTMLQKIPLTTLSSLKPKTKHNQYKTSSKILAAYDFST